MNSHTLPNNYYEKLCLKKVKFNDGFSERGLIE